MRNLLAVLFTLLTAVFLLEYIVVGQAVYGDGRYYWAITRSLYFSQNIDISDEMSHLYSPENNNIAAPDFKPQSDFATSTKTITNSFSLGISLIWLPLYFLADVVVMLFSSLGISFVRNGYSDTYQILVGLGNIGFVVSGIGLLISMLRERWKTSIVIPVITTVVFATNLLYYGSLDVINSHPVGFLLVTILLWLFLRDRKVPHGRMLFFQGLVVGFLMANRSQDMFFGLLPLVAIMAFHSKVWIDRIKNFFVVGIGVFLGYLPQLLILYAGQDKVVLLPHTDQAFHLPQHFLGIIFDPKLGIFWYMPLFLIGVFGLYLFRKKDAWLAYTFLGVILLHYLAIASWAGWHQASYTMRYFISLLPLIAFGLAEVFGRLSKRCSQKVIYAVVILAIMHQVSMIFYFKLFLQDATTVGSEISQSGKVKEVIRQKLDALLP